LHPDFETGGSGGEKSFRIWIGKKGRKEKWKKRFTKKAEFRKKRFANGGMRRWGGESKFKEVRVEGGRGNERGGKRSRKKKKRRGGEDRRKKK